MLFLGVNLVGQKWSVSKNWHFATLLKNIHPCVHHVGVHHVVVHHIHVHHVHVHHLFVFVFVITRREPISHFKSLNSMLLINIACIGSWKHFVSVFVCVCVPLSLYLSSCKSLSWSLSSPDEKLSENTCFVWSRTSYGGDKWRCKPWRRTNKWI